MQVTLPDGTPLELPDGATGADAAAAIGARLAKAALAVGEEGDINDLSAPLREGQRLTIVTERDQPAALQLIRHDAAHVLATAVLELYPGVKIAIGPPIADGFYYDFDVPEGMTLSDQDFEAIEAKMGEHIRADEPFVRSDITVAEALERFRAEGQDFKVELIEDLVRDADPAHPVETVSLYTNGPFTDLCRGPHAPSTGRIKAFRLQSVAGAYWRGDASRQMLTRVYGTAFLSQKDLDAHLERLELARASDHRRLGPQLGLFTFSDTATGAAFWLPEGTKVFNQLIALSRAMCEERAYTEVKTPQLYNADLWRTSGHWFKYRDHMFTTEAEGREMALKPMNCPGHCELFKLQRWSYRDLPVRYSEPGLLHRNELSGALHGLLRVRHFAQDDAHIFCTPEQVLEEVQGCLDMAFDTYARFGIEPDLELSTRPEERIGDDAQWDEAEALLTRALDDQKLSYKLNEGDGAFYGPKVDLHFTDSLGRSWQLGTVQLDFQLPERFDLTYTAADNTEHRVVMLHRALFGSFERFIGILIEHLGGELPVWLAPTQALVLPIADRHAQVAGQVAERLRAGGVRAALDERTESVGRKIREAELRKVPYMLVVGDRELEEDTIAVREHGRGDTGSEAVEAFTRRVVAQTPQ
ncbi:MAG TPA: threonine--tRNA ligase [Solirubrobacteraceae bacterium]|nr:threonine--tRNA ligase [Solirubrobacteraceae bacterium]